MEYRDHNTNFRKAEVVIRYLIIDVLLLVTAGAFVVISIIYENQHLSVTELPFLEIKSIDTMKYSRDRAREKMHDASFSAEIDKQLSAIAATGANYVAIGTPYDEEFIPFLKLWVDSARRHNLHVWFRGNFSGWEQWYGYQSISSAEHQQLLHSFITSHSDLFAADDIFTPCTECENGSLGDPRKTGKVDEFRNFLIAEYTQSNKLFKELHIPVKVGYLSMNYDVATLVMDRKTVSSLGGIVVIDHYVTHAEQLIEDIHTISDKTDGKIVLGEFGVPIPHIHDKMTENEQVHWLNTLLTRLSTMPEIIGVNYWVNMDGSSALWKKDGTATQAVSVITEFYKKPRYPPAGGPGFMK